MSVNGIHLLLYFRSGNYAGHNTEFQGQWLGHEWWGGACNGGEGHAIVGACGGGGPLWPVCVCTCSHGVCTQCRLYSKQQLITLCC